MKVTPPGPAGIILAAGRSRRMGFPKPLMLFSGVTFLRRIIDIHHAAGLPVWVVLGHFREAILRELVLSDVTVLTNPDPDRGQLSSLQVGIRQTLDRTGILIHPVDHPAVQAETVATLLRSHQEEPESIIIPEYSGRKGHPVLFPRRFYADLLLTPLQEGARYVVHHRAEAIRIVSVQDAGILRNIDTPADYGELDQA
jgi:molybdenum cofactor cytidylyltransferase